ncbi:MAG: threonine--tRNA ligase [Terriglobia bacterium]|nr:threonine--tRNA ligase [Terriglobia bacterium]
MINITLPDGSQRQFENPVTVGDVAASIGAGLAKAALAGKVGDKLVDTSYRIDHDASLAIITEKSPEALDILRHSTAHLLAQATQRLFPDTQVTIGPVVENGFYYDFARKTPFTPEDLDKIEAEMKKIVGESLPVERRVMRKDDAIKFFKDKGEVYKAQIIDEIIPPGEEISLYGQGDWVDLCRGPHVPNTNKLRAFKLMKVAGAYWRGDSNNEMLQRVYGTAWLNDKDLKAYLTQLEEAEKRDHRKLAKQLDLFHLQEEAPGLIFWHPKGWSIWQVVEQYMRRVYRETGYGEVKAPQVLDVALWKKSGHWDNYKDNMFFTESEKRTYALKPMNCPGHVQIFNHGLHSYRDLPIRYGEFGGCHRNEPSGALHGILRVRGFTQDDAHIFCTTDQIVDEVVACIDFAKAVLDTFGFDKFQVELSTWDPNDKKNYAGSDDQWKLAEHSLEIALKRRNIEYKTIPGEAAFYGPKIDVKLVDAIGRLWQLSTVQFDFNLPARFGLEYVGEDGQRHQPVMVHRALYGSVERFFGVLIEHYAGAFPLWLSPVQVAIVPIAERHAEYANKVAAELRGAGIRVEVDARNEKMNAKIREFALQKIPFILVVGDKEAESGQVNVRVRGQEKAEGTVSTVDFVERVKRLDQSKSTGLI